MKHLYIIGNGFDLFTGLRTRYVDFRHWLELNYPFIYENMSAAYEMDGEWWNDFESQLGKLNVKRYIKKFTPPEKPMDELLTEIKERKAFERKYNLPPNLFYEKPCANRLKGLLDVLQYCFERWVDNCQRIIENPKYAKIERDNSYFISFNYTDVLEWLYKIPEERVLHIHGRASKHDHLVFGHGNHLHGGIISNPDEDETCFELNLYEKNPYEYIFKHDQLPNILSDAEFVHIYGFSFSARFRIEAPDAKSVIVSLGLGGRGGTVLKKDKDGVWTGTTDGPMDEGFHYYHLTIDGATVNDCGRYFICKYLADGLDCRD